MNNILVQHSNNKFIRTTIFSSIEDVNIMGATINNNLYQIFYSIKPTHVIFDSSILTKEIAQFVTDFSNTVKCFFYHHKISSDTIKYFESYNVFHLTHEQNYSNIIHIPDNLVNTQLFYNNTNIIKQNNLVCFLENLPIIPDFLKDYLYPKSKLPIKLFNSSQAPHHQNLGLLNEKEKAAILQQNKYYLVLSENDPYTNEAKNCGSIIVNIHNIDKYSLLEYNEPESLIDFNTFFKENIL